MSSFNENRSLKPIFLRDALAEIYAKKYPEEEKFVAILLMSRAVNQLLSGLKKIQATEKPYVKFSEENSRNPIELTPFAISFLQSLHTYEDITEMSLKRQSFMEKALMLLQLALPVAFDLQDQKEQELHNLKKRKEIMKPNDLEDVFRTVKVDNLDPQQLKNAERGAYDLTCEILKTEKDFLLESFEDSADVVAAKMHQYFLSLFRNFEAPLYPRQLQALLLFFSFDGAPRLKNSAMYQHVADELGLNVSGLKHTIAEAIKTLRKMLGTSPYLLRELL